jgi:ribosome-interacting GTPase 1
MASTNQSPFYKQAEAKFLAAKTNEEKLKWLEEMIRECPRHKSSEKMLANLKTRHIKLKEKIESQKKTAKGSKKPGIKKEEMQAVIIGFTNSGKSTLLSLLTNTNPEIAPYSFVTKSPIIGMMHYTGTNIQVIEIPAIESDYFDKSTVYTTDTMIILIKAIEHLKEIEKLLPSKPKIIVFNINEEQEKDIRKIEATLKSKKYNFVVINLEQEETENLEELKEKIFQSFNKIRVYTKEPGKEKSQRPFILEKNSTIETVAEKIFHGFSKQIKETKIWGPSSKFPGQIVGLKHQLKDLDVVEFKTR